MSTTKMEIRTEEVQAETMPAISLPPGYLAKQELSNLAQAGLGRISEEAGLMLKALRTPERLSAMSTPAITMVAGNETRAYSALTFTAYFKAVENYVPGAMATIASWNVKNMDHGVEKLARRMQSFADQIEMKTAGIAYNGAGRIVQYLAAPAAVTTLMSPKNKNVFEAMGMSVTQDANLGKVLKRLRSLGTGGDAAMFHPITSTVNLETGIGVLNLPNGPLSFMLVDDPLGGTTNSGSIRCRQSTALQIVEAFDATMPPETSRLQIWITTDEGQLKGMCVLNEDVPLPEGIDIVVAKDSLATEIKAPVTAGKMNFWSFNIGTEVLEVEGLQMEPNLVIHTGAQQLADHQTEVGHKIMSDIADAVSSGKAFERLMPENVESRQAQAIRVSLDGEQLRMPDAERAKRLSDQLGIAGPWASAELMREATLKVSKMRAFDTKQTRKGLPGCFAIGFKSISTDASLFEDGVPDGEFKILWNESKNRSTPNGVGVNATTFAEITSALEGHDHDDSLSCFLFPGKLFAIRTPSTFESGALLPTSREDLSLLNNMGLKRFSLEGPGKQHPNLHEMEPVHAGVLYEDGYLKWDRDPWKMLNTVQPHLDNVAAIGRIALLVAALIHSGNFRPLEHLVSNSDVIDRVHKMDGDPWPAYYGLLEAICHCIRNGDLFEPNTWAAIADRVQERYLEMTDAHGTPFVSEIDRETFRINDVVLLSPNTGSETVTDARHDLIRRLERFVSRLVAYANGNHQWMVEKQPLEVRRIAEQLVQQTTQEWSHHFRSNADDDVARSNVGQMATEAYDRAKAIMGDDYQMGSFSACVAQSQAVQRTRFPVNVDEPHKSLSLSLLGEMPWAEQICFWAFPEAGQRAMPTWRTRIRPYGNVADVKLDTTERYSVTKSTNGHYLLVKGDWWRDGVKNVVGQLGPEGAELAYLRQVKLLGEIPKTGADGEADQSVILLGVPEKHALREEKP
jgi:hypothetical protein